MNCLKVVTSFVPIHTQISDVQVIKLKEFVTRSGKLLILTGAGVSTESGIPDYRSKDVGLYATSSHKPITYQEFVKNSELRKRYWIRNFIGWPRFSSLLPNSTHHALQNMEKEQICSCIVTQNVDRLHSKAGSEQIVELHGTTYHVICLNCDYSIERYKFQSILQRLNPNVQLTSDVIRPDGDVNILENQVSFIVPNCPKCGGNLKPDVVFFGENVPRDRVNQVEEEVRKCDSVLVLGSSLMVFSAYRIILQAVQLNKPIAIVNIGTTRGDNHAKLKIEAKCGDILPLLLPM